ncbi:mediator of RNA polymerase II transcription subunit 27 isoform X2 [Nymphaea colorata]|uniref:mediator of RNA polymerase II transcription subunit 27 isoform X2 n=1 Tax=Nymphaea colorata TaxID=210225 RepID=UPI00129DECFB|nr:mediator of RNA polymerase II transcription subunit 27 isoform X2 [Nymphaea colorata]
MALERPDPGATKAEAPPKQVALAMEQLTEAARIIADIRVGADRFLEALFVAASAPPSARPIHLIQGEESAMQENLQKLRLIGKKLEASGVLTGSNRTRGSPWGLHMPLVCRDGSVVAYAWKRQLAGQAAASAVDRSRLALKAFADQKKRFFPHLEDEMHNQKHSGEFGASKKLATSVSSVVVHKDEPYSERSLSDILNDIEAESSFAKISTYQRLDWLKRASSLSPSANEPPGETSKENNVHTSSKIRAEVQGAPALDQIAVIELLVPSVFRAVVSLNPAGSINPDAVAFFSPDEEYADRALQYFLGAEGHGSLQLLLRWICSYHTLFSKVCSKCGRLLALDRQSSLHLPPVCHTYRQSHVTRTGAYSQMPSTLKDLHSDPPKAYHFGCSPDDI